MSGRKVVYKTTYAKGDGARRTTRHNSSARQTAPAPVQKDVRVARVLVLPREDDPSADEQPSVTLRAVSQGHAGKSKAKTTTRETTTRETKVRASTAREDASRSSTGRKPATKRTGSTSARSKAAVSTMDTESAAKDTPTSGTSTRGAASGRRSDDGGASGASTGAGRGGAHRKDGSSGKSSGASQTSAKSRRPTKPVPPTATPRDGLDAASPQTPVVQRHAKRLDPPISGELTPARSHTSRSSQSLARQAEEATRDRTTIELPAIREETEGTAAVEAAAVESLPTIELRATSRAHTAPPAPSRRRSPAPPKFVLPTLARMPAPSQPIEAQDTVVNSVRVETPRETPLPDLSSPRVRQAMLTQPRMRTVSAPLALSRSTVRRVTSRARVRRERAKLTRGRVIVLGVLAFLLLVMVAGGIPLVSNYVSLYHRDTALASTAMAHLKTAETALTALQTNPFDSAHIAQARAELAAAHTNFWQIQGDLGSLPGVSSAVPVVGSKLQSARKLLPLALEATQGGMIALDALSLLGERIKDPFGASGATGTTSAKSTGLTSADWTTLTGYFNQLDGLFTTAVQQINALQPDDLTLDSRLGPAVQSIRKNLPNIENGLSVAQTVIALGPQLLGISSPTNYLVEVLDSTELRPGGGFVGNYGFLTLNHGLLGDVKMRDVDLLDRSPTNLAKTIPVPTGYSWFDVASSWGLRDSNIEANFPTSAQFGEQLLKELGDNTSVQGVITITPWLIENAMKITGPIKVPEFNETVTADTLVNTIHKYQLGAGHGSDLIVDPDSGSSQRKRFSALLFAHFIAQVKTDLSSHMAQFVRLFTSSLQSKDIQIYLNNAKAEALLQKYNIASMVESPPGDGLMVVDANITGNKANYFINYTMNDSVTLDAQGNATHHTTLTYAWPVSAYATANEYGGSAAFIYEDYVRLYAPAGSTLLNQSGWTARGTSTAFDRAVFAGNLFMSYGQTAVITLDWRSPHAATHDASGWHYTSFVEKQAGVTWKIISQVALAKGCTIAGTPGLLTKHDASHATLTQYLTTNITLKLDYGGCS